MGLPGARLGEPHTESSGGRAEMSEIRARREEILSELKPLEARCEGLRDGLAELRKLCHHPDLPKRVMGEEYMDECPDCGFTQYCCSIG